MYELTGDSSYTRAELAAEISQQSGRTLPYVNLSETDYKAALLQAGLPEPLAELLANSDAGAAVGGLFGGSKQLSTLIRRVATPIRQTVATALVQ